jgi:hypothetical protein
MKIVQSFWTKPFLQSDGFSTRLNGGWPSRRYNYLSWALSCCQLRKYYPDIELITDDMGKFILIDKLQLPYTQVSTALNDINQYNSSLWCMGKVYAYSLQNTPFLHVDNDIFIWKPFDDRITHAGLTAQNKEARNLDYSSFLKDVHRIYPYVPDLFREFEGVNFAFSSNLGIAGGVDMDFYKTFTSEAFRFIQENNDFINNNYHKKDLQHTNLVFEQCMFNVVAKKQKKEITYLFPGAIAIPAYVGFFHESDRNDGFVHCLDDYKQCRLVYRTLEMKVKTLYPDCYERIRELLDCSEI